MIAVRRPVTDFTVAISAVVANSVTVAIVRTSLVLGLKIAYRHAFLIHAHLDGSPSKQSQTMYQFMKKRKIMDFCGFI